MDHGRGMCWRGCQLSSRLLKWSESHDWSRLVSITPRTVVSHLAPVVTRAQIEVKNNYLHLLEACIQSKSLTEAKKIHQHFLKNTSNADSSVLHKLTRLYLSCNQVVLARRLFDEIPNPSVILWNQIIRAYAWNGPFDGAIDFVPQYAPPGCQTQ
ncbi:Pentatricopeptide repeat-containing protein [Vitis vinifera]|uniref:Pentatricopeptide repeat-containing protein n=1 Tax=Vitis vinifera TaxID=29760 RepID=A0A438FP43_VITVI|nr:Pentatricopeptide repeat-containing protein [Vitis vinifera]